MKIRRHQLKTINDNRNKPLVAAARYNDQQAALDENIEKTVTDLGIDFQNLKYIIDQRIMRLPPAVQAGHLMAIRLAYIDAICIGWTARSFVGGTEKGRSVRIKDEITMEEWDAWCGNDKGGEK